MNHSEMIDNNIIIKLKCVFYYLLYFDINNEKKKKD